MTKTVRLILCLLAVFLLQAHSAFAQGRILRVGIYDFLPLSAVNSDGVAQGLYPEVLEHIADKEGWEIVWVNGTWSQCLQRMKAGTLDLLVSISHSKQRESFVSFNQEPMLITWGRVYTRAGFPIKSLLDLRDKTVVVLKDDYYNASLRRQLDAFGIKCAFREVDRATDSFRAVYQGKADAVGSERFFARRYIDRYALIASPIIYGPGDMLFAAPKGKNLGILAALDRHLKKLKSNQSSIYHQALARWLSGAKRPLPEWIHWALVMAAGLLLVMVMASLVLRHQVKVRTRELTESNENLRFEVAERTQAQEALAASEEQLRSIFNTAAIGIALVNREGRYTQLNPTWEAILGYQSGELLWADYLSVTHPDDREMSDNNLQRLRQGDHTQYRAEKRYIKKNGEVIWGEITVSKLELARGKQADTLGILVDITERKTAERLLRRSEERLRAVFNAATVGIAVVGPDGRFEQVNPALAAMLGYTAARLIGMEVDKVIHPEDRGILQGPHSLVLGNGSGYDGQVRFVPAEGPWFWGAVSVNLIQSGDQDREAALWMIADVTESRRAQEALEESEYRYRQLFDSIGDLIITHDLNGNVITINRAAANLLGWEPSRVVGKNIRDFMFPSDEQGVSQDYLGSLAQGQTVSGLSGYHGADGGKRYIEYTSSLVREEGEEPFVSCSGRDVTERILAERELRQLEEQLLQSQKMEAVGTLASGIAHDFNNILQAISGYVQLMSLKGRPEQDEEDYLSQILLSVERASQLVQRMLAFGRKMTSSPQATDINKVVNDALKVLEVALPKMIEISIDLQSDLASVHADRNQLFQVLMNLGSNAKDAMGQQGRLEITTRDVELDREYCRRHVGMQPGRYVMLKVADNGQGMQEEILAHIFNPFFTTKGVGEGTGLGLSTVYGIVKAHKGHILCESQPGRGTTFTMYLPAMDTEAEPERSGQAPRDQVAGGRETIMLVDDEPAVLDVGQTILTDHGYQVLTAERGEQALEVFREAGGDISLVVLDLNMPGMGGARCLRELRKIDPQVKVIVASGYSEKMNQHTFSLEGAEAYLAKPYSLGELLSTIRATLDQDDRAGAGFGGSS